MSEEKCVIAIAQDVNEVINKIKEKTGYSKKFIIESAIKEQYSYVFEKE